MLRYLATLTLGTVLVVGCGEAPGLERQEANLNVTPGIWTHNGLSLVRTSTGTWIDATGNTILLAANQAQTVFTYTRVKAWGGKLRCSIRMIKWGADVSPGSLLTQYGVAPRANNIYMSSGNSSGSTYGCWELQPSGVEVRRVPRDSEVRLYNTPNNASYVGVEFWDGQGGSGYALTSSALIPGTI